MGGKKETLAGRVRVIKWEGLGTVCLPHVSVVLEQWITAAVATILCAPDQYSATEPNVPSRTCLTAWETKFPIKSQGGSKKEYLHLQLFHTVTDFMYMI